MNAAPQMGAEEAGQGGGWLAQLREPHTWRAALAGAAVGLAGGFVAFWVGSSRGLDSIHLGDLLAGVGILVAAALLVLGIARALWFDDLRLAIATVTIIAGFSLGTQVAFRALPGDTTDGSLAVSVGAAIGAAPGTTSQRLAKCTWDRPAGVVRTVESRSPMIAVPHVPIEVHLEVAGPAQVATLVVVALTPVDHVPVIRYEGRAAPAELDATGRSGAVIVAALSSEALPAEGADPELVDFVTAQLEEVGVAARATIAWDCPQLP